MDWRHLVSWSVKLAMATVDAPKVVLDILHQTAKEVVLEDFPEFGNIHQDVFVRFPELSYVESIRNLRHAPHRPFCPVICLPTQLFVIQLPRNSSCPLKALHFLGLVLVFEMMRL